MQVYTVGWVDIGLFRILCICMLFDVPRNVLKIGPLNVWLSLVVGQNISLIIIIIIILHLGELQTTYKCLKPKIHPPYFTMYARYKYSTQYYSTHTPRSISFSILPTGALV